MGVNVYDQERAQSANILTMAINADDLNSVLYEDCIDSFSAGVPADGSCFGTVHTHTNHVQENINFHPKGFVSIVKKVCWLFGVSVQR